MDAATLIHNTLRGDQVRATVGSTVVDAVVASISLETRVSLYGSEAGYMQSAYIDKDALGTEPASGDLVTISGTQYRVLGVYRYAGTTLRRLDLADKYAS